MTYPYADDLRDQFILLEDAIGIDIICVCVLFQTGKGKVLQMIPTTSSDCSHS